MIGIGVDLVDVHRFRTVLQRRAQISERLFTKNELSYCNLATDPTERLAARFAATKDHTGRPDLKLHGAAAQLAQSSGVHGWHISLSHTSSLAEAFVIAE